MNCNNSPDNKLGNAMFRQEDFATWTELETHVRELLLRNAAASKQQSGHSSVLFRGQASYGWLLDTTLERAQPQFSELSEYYRTIAAVKTQVETFTASRWDEIDYQAVAKHLQSYDALRFGRLPSYDYLVYLRHQGFPSPLLDWSRSLYVAAFFAVQAPKSERVAIFGYQEHTGHGKFDSSDSSRIFAFGPNVRTHPRHFLQQGEYTLCCQFLEGTWHFKSHATVFDKSEDTQDRLWKFTLPASEAPVVLDQLEQYNINAYSLFQSEEALMQTLARRLLSP